MTLKTDVYSSSDKYNALLPGCTECSLRNSKLKSPCTHANQRHIVIPCTRIKIKAGFKAFSCSTPHLSKNFSSIVTQSLSQSLLKCIYLEKKQNRPATVSHLLLQTVQNTYTPKQTKQTQIHLPTPC